MTYSASQQINELENLLAAWRQVRQAVRQTPDVNRALGVYEQSLRMNLQRLAQRLHSGRYRPPASQAPLPARLDDAVVQQAALNVLKPLLASKPSYEVRDVKSALDRLRHCHARGAEYVVTGAVAAFPQTLHQTLLLRRLEVQLADRPLLVLIEQWCAAGLLFAEPAEPGMAAPFNRMFVNLRETAWQLAQPLFARWLPQTGFANDEQFAAHVWETAANTRALEDEALRQQLRQEARQRLTGALLVAGLAFGLLFVYSERFRQLPRPKFLAMLGGASGLLAACAMLAGRNNASGNANLTPQTQTALERLLANELLRDFELAVTGAGWPLVRIGSRFAITAPDEQSARASFNLAEQVLWQMGWQLESEQVLLTRFEPDLEMLGRHFAI